MSKVIRASESNAHKFKQLVRDWPELAQTVASLRNDGLFPGIRAMTLIVDDHHDGDPFDAIYTQSETPCPSK